MIDTLLGFKRTGRLPALRVDYFSILIAWAILIQNSPCLTLLDETRQIGFARLVTDWTDPSLISSITLKSSITRPVASARRPLNRPHCEDRICLRLWRHSNFRAGSSTGWGQSKHLKTSRRVSMILTLKKGILEQNLELNNNCALRFNK